MANLKNITELPVAESAEGLNLIVNDNGAAKQIAASAVDAQADWAVTDENSPAFIKNKPVEEWDLDIRVESTWNTETDASNDPVFTANEGYSYEAFIAKIESGDVPKVKMVTSIATSPDFILNLWTRAANITEFEEDIYMVYIMGPSLVGIILLPDGTFDLMMFS